MSSRLRSWGSAPARYLGVRVGLLVAGVMALLLFGTLALAVSAIDQSFGALQNRSSVFAMERLARVLNQMAEAQRSFVVDYGLWDDSFVFLRDRSGDYLERNFAPDTDTSKQDLVVLFDRDRRVFVLINPTTGEREFPPGLDPAVFRDSQLFAEDGRAGLFALGDEVWLAAASPVRPNDGGDPLMGWILFAQRLSSERLTDVVEASGIRGLTLDHAGRERSPDEIQRTIPTDTLGPATAWIPRSQVVRAGESDPEGELLVPAVLGDSPLRLRVRLGMSVFTQAVETRNGIMVAAISVGLLMVALGVAAIQVLVIRPITRLDQQMQAHAASEELSAPVVSTDRRDEIGRLAASANRLLERVQAGKDEATHAHRLVNSILDSALEGVVACRAVRDGDGQVADFRVVECNLSAATLSRTSRAEALGETMFTLFPEARETGLFEDCVAVVNGTGQRVLEREFSGPRVLAWLRLSIVPWGDGVVITFSDITDRKRRERELAASFAEIERFNAAMIGREERVIELKREVNSLLRDAGRPPRYADTDALGEGA